MEYQIDKYKLNEIAKYISTETASHFDAGRIKQDVEKILNGDSKALIDWTKGEILNERDRLWGMINELDYELFRREEHMWEEYSGILNFGFKEELVAGQMMNVGI